MKTKQIIAALLLLSAFVQAQPVKKENRDTQRYLNRLGVFALSSQAGMDYERFPNHTPTFSVGVTMGLIFNETDVFVPDGAVKTNFYALNPYVRYYFFKPSPWFRLGWDVKYSNVLADPGADFRKMTYFPSVESHISLSTQYKRIFLLLGIGVKHVFSSKTLTEQWHSTTWPDGSLNLPAADLSIGYQF